VQVLFDTTNTRVSFIDKETETIFVCFTSLGVRKEYHQIDFRSLSKKYSVIFVTDKTNSWGNNIEWDNIAKIINDKIANKKSYSIGVSMGGTNSILSSNYLNTNYVISFNPQFSIHPTVEPASIYLEYANKITHWKHKTIKSSFKNKKTFYTFVSTNDANDVKYIDIYPEHLYNCGKNFGHNLAFDLKNAGLLQGLLDVIVLGHEDITKYITDTIKPE
jgi:hypothetical protein